MVWFVEICDWIFNMWNSGFFFTIVKVKKTPFVNAFVLKFFCESKYFTPARKPTPRLWSPLLLKIVIQVFHTCDKNYIPDVIAVVSDHLWAQILHTRDVSHTPIVNPLNTNTYITTLQLLFSSQIKNIFKTIALDNNWCLWCYSIVKARQQQCY